MSGADRRRFEELKEAYALGALPDDESREFEGILSAHPEFQNEVDDLAQVAALLAASPVDREPPRRSKKSLMAAVTADAARRRSAPSRSSRLSRWLGAVLTARPIAIGAAGLLVVALVSWNLLLHGQIRDLDTDNSELQARVESAQSETSDSRVLTLSGQDETQQTQAEVVSLRDGRAVLLAEDMPSIPEGRTFQIWVIQGENASPSGLFQPSEEPVATVVKNTLQNADAVAVTVEPAGGSPQPTSDPMLVAEV